MDNNTSVFNFVPEVSSLRGGRNIDFGGMKLQRASIPLLEGKKLCSLVVTCMEEMEKAIERKDTSLWIFDEWDTMDDENVRATHHRLIAALRRKGYRTRYFNSISSVQITVSWRL